MAKADYWAVEKELHALLDSRLNDCTVVMEQDMQVAAEMTPWVCVYLNGREVPSSQPIAGGRVIRVRVRFSIWIWCHNMELGSAVMARDALLGEIEMILAENRTLNNTVDGLWIEGGELPSVKDPGSPGFFSGGEIVISSELRAEV